jgi:ABC-type enterochelin transport system ATPase subunit
MVACVVALPKGLSIDRIAEEMEQAAQNKLWVMSNTVALRAKYADKFVACKNGKIIASANTSEEVFRKLRKKRESLSVVAIEFVSKTPLIRLL